MYQVIVRKTREFLRDEQGPTATEYAVMLALIFLVIITGASALGTKVNDNFVQATQGW